MTTLRVSIVDDDVWKRSAMADLLADDDRVEVNSVLGQDEAVALTDEAWARVDLAIVDIFDEAAPGEVGTDLFSGIGVLGRLRDRSIRTMAITPHCQHPLVRQRIAEAEPDWLYHRWEVNQHAAFVQAVLEPADDEDHCAVPPSRESLAELGAAGAAVNEAVAIYEQSGLYPHLRPGVGIKSLPVTRYDVGSFRELIGGTGFVGTSYRDETGATERRNHGPRWTDVRDFLLAAIGRRDAPSTETDRSEVDGWPGHHATR